MKNITAALAVIASLSQYLCIFCCVVPAVAGLASLLTMIGFDGESSHFLGDVARIFHPWRGIILGSSLALISLSWGLWYYNHRQSLSPCGCTGKGAKKPYFLIAATVILAFNLAGYQWIHG